MKITIIGGGNVGAALAFGLRDAGMPPPQVWMRGGGGEPAAADLYIIAVPDRVIGEVAARFGFGGAVVAHTAGSVGLDALESVKNRAVLYPLQTFTSGRSVDFQSVPMLIEGVNAHSLGVVRRVAEALSDNVLEVDSARRLTLHAAAVFANNFTNHMYAAAEELAHGAGFDFEILKPLILETAQKVLDSSSPRDVQTGPAVRGDLGTIRRHAGLLSLEPRLQGLYNDISNSIWEISKKI